MAQYSSAVPKTWILNTSAGFKEGAFNGTEFENPNYIDRVVLACDIGINIINNPPTDWNPSFERKHPTENRPEDWVLDFVWGSAGSEYVQNGPEPYDGEDYIRLKNENLHKGLLGLQPGQSPYAVNLIIDQAKFYTVRYHGRFRNPQFETPRSCDGMVTLGDTDASGYKETPYGFAPFAQYDPLPTDWALSDYRIHPNAALLERKIQALVISFGEDNANYFPGESWDIDMVVVAETFPLNATFYASGQYESPVLYTPPTVSRVSWGLFEVVVDIPTDTAIDFFVRGYDMDSREWTDYFPISPNGDIDAVFAVNGHAQYRQPRLQWKAQLRWTGQGTPTTTPQISSVTVHYNEQFRTDHPRVMFDSDSLPGLRTKIQSQAYQDTTWPEYVKIRELAYPILGGTPQPPNDPPSAYYEAIMNACFIYAMAIEGNYQQYAAGACVWVADLLQKYPYIKWDQDQQKWGLNPVYKVGGLIASIAHRTWVARTLTYFYDWCNAYLVANQPTLKETVATTLLQINYYANYDYGADQFHPDNRCYPVYENLIVPVAAIWDDYTIYDKTYQTTTDHPAVIPPKDLISHGEIFHVDDHIPYMKNHFGDGTSAEGSAYGTKYIERAGIFFKIWTTLFLENWFTDKRASFLRNMLFAYLFRLAPDGTVEKMVGEDGGYGAESSVICPILTIPASEYDATERSIGHMVRYMTEDILKWYPASAGQPPYNFFMFARVIWRDALRGKTPPGQMLPLGLKFWSRGEVFFRTDWEFDPAPNQGDYEYYYGFMGKVGTNQKGVYLAFKSGPAITGHNHADQNCFTLFAQGHLAVDSGFYDGNPSNHWDNYHARTIARNAVLIFDPAELYPHVPGEKTPGSLSNDGGETLYQYEGDYPDNYLYYDLVARTRDAGAIERYEHKPRYGYVFGRATKAYNSYDYNDNPVFQKCSLATREVVFVRPFDPYGGGLTDYPHFVVIYDDVTRVVSLNELAKTQWVIHAVEKPAIKTDAGWESPPGDYNAGWSPSGQNPRVFRMDALNHIPTPPISYKGRLFGITLFTQTNTTFNVLGNDVWLVQPPDNQYRNFVNGQTYIPITDSELNKNPDQPWPWSAPPAALNGDWRIEINVPGSQAQVRYLHVLWPADKDIAEPVSCALVTSGVPSYFRGAFIRPQTGEHGGILHHVVGFADLGAAYITYDVDVETHTNHIICRLVPSATYRVVITAPGVSPWTDDLDAGPGGVLNFDHDRLTPATATHHVEITLIGEPLLE